MKPVWKRSRTRTAWYNMLARCLSSNHPKYKHYGGRGITVCERWKNSFANFFSDMGEVPPNYSLDRIDPNKDYQPDNCRWATKALQAQNMRSNKFIEHDGQRLCYAEWARKLGISRTHFTRRVKDYGEAAAISMGPNRRAWANGKHSEFSSRKKAGA